MPNISETLNNASQILEKNGVAAPRREAKSLLAFALSKDQTFLVAHSEYELSAAENAEFQGFLVRRAAREPFQYITGRQEFYGLEFIVSPDVLIPRPETELLVEAAVEILQNIDNARFCEVGVGSGCISIAILHNTKNASATGADISPTALETARKNAEVHGVAERFDLQISDVFDALPIEKYDLIASNPPYISSAEIKNLQPEVRGFEPKTALTDGADGLSIAAKIIRDAPLRLKSRSFLLLEIGFGQAAAVAELFAAEIWEKIEFIPDWQRIPRIVKARLVD